LQRLRFARPVFLALFAAQFVILDTFFRGTRVLVDRPIHAVFAVESIILWTVLAIALGSTRPRRIVLALFAAIVFGVQAFLYRYLQTPLDVQVAEAALHSWSDVRPIILKNLPHVALVSLVAFGVGIACLELAPRIAAQRSKAAGFGVVALFGLFGDDPRHATPDARGLHALSALERKKAPPVVGAIALPPLHSERREVPNILFVLTESVRADDYGPATAPYTAQLLRERFELAEMRSVASFTVISLSALVTGRSQEALRDDILRGANIFDFGHAAGAWVSYHSAHSREIFETKDVRAAADRFFTLEDLAQRENVDDDADLIVQHLDRMTVDRFIADLPRGRDRPILAMLHLEATHAPYYFEERDARFTPWDRVIAWSNMSPLRNAYKNSIVVQDKEIARAIEAFIATSRNAPWLVVFTSDHGEAFGEHGAIHHGQGLHDPQVHVPAWIAAGNGALDPAQESALRQHASRFVTHLDVLPTILDAMGLWENFAIREHTEAMKGRSLLRPQGPRPIIPVTNCTTMFKCVLNTWGLFSEDRKLISQSWDNGWWCFDLRGGEHVAPASDPVCTSLREESRRLYPVLPNGAPNR
jgi:hypothetical protein